MTYSEYRFFINSTDSSSVALSYLDRAHKDSKITPDQRRELYQLFQSHLSDRDYYLW